ncbi:MAG TPA: hypothetical protein VJS92_18155 [Candidatus Polarisedimenticolaceae bacterium]|nr:hypothetical protein [Candidatus Polarisedimenticolaceae bacterium]
MITRGLTFRRWVLATWIGWILGIPCIIALALLGEAVGIGGSQGLVGAGMGAGVGWMQSRALRGILDRRQAWLASCIGGLAVPFVATDVAKLLGWQSLYSVYPAVALGGLIAGVWQASILRARFDRTFAWGLASALGWTLAAGAVAVSDWLSHSHSLRGIWGALAYLGIIAMGGLLVGAVTGLAFAWMPRRES